MLIVSFVSTAKLCEIHGEKALYVSLVTSSEICYLFMRKPEFVTVSLMMGNEAVTLAECILKFLLN